MRDNRIDPKTIFSQAPEREEVFIKKTKEKITRAEAGKHLAQFHLSCELLKVINRFFPGLLKQIRDPRDQRYITYQCQVLLMTRILSTIFYISSMRKASEEFNSEIMIENIGYLSGQELTELPYWETINDYLKGSRLPLPVALQERQDTRHIRGIPEIKETGRKLPGGKIPDTGKGKREKEKEEKTVWYDHVTGIWYEEHYVNFMESGEGKYPFYFLTDLPVTKRNVKELSEAGKRRWAIKNEGFNTQKNHGYNLCHRFSHNYRAWKNHYYLIQIGHMIS